MARIAFFGLGNIGTGICRAVAAGNEVRAYDPRPEAFDALVDRGVQRASSVADAVALAEVVLVVVRDDAQVRDVLLGTDGALVGLPAGAIVVLHSTVAPATVREVAGACSAAGIRFVDAGVSSGGGRAVGDYYAMCGGDAATIEEITPVLRSYCSDVVRFGATGAGMAAKLVRNAMRYALWGVLYEGMALAEAAGLDLTAMAHLYRGTFGTSSDDEMVLARPTMAPLDPAAGPDAAAHIAAMLPMVTLGWKDLDVAAALAAEVGADFSMLAAARPRYGPSFGLALRDEHDLTGDPAPDDGGTR